MSVTYLWLLAGVTFLAAEALGASGIGLLFAGLGAIVVGILINFGAIAEDAMITQFIVFFIATAIWAALLWKPMQRFRLGTAKGYSNIVGETAYVGSSGLDKQNGGEVTWSGTIMKAELAGDATVQRLDAGSQVVIVDVVGAKLIVKPK